MSVKQRVLIIALVAIGLVLLGYILLQPEEVEQPHHPQQQNKRKREIGLAEPKSESKSRVKVLTDSQSWTGVAVVAKSRPTWHKGHISHLSVKGRNRSKPEFESLPPLPVLESLPQVNLRYDSDKLYLILKKEKGLRKLIQMWEALTVEDTSGCLTHQEAIDGRLHQSTKSWCVKRETLQDKHIDRFESFQSFSHPQPIPEPRIPKEMEARLGSMMWPGFPFIDGRAFKEVADCAHETNNFLFSMGTALRRTKCYGNQIFNRSLVYWYLDAVDLAKLRTRLFEEHFVADDIKFFLIVHNLDTPKFPLWLLEHPQILKIFSVNVNSSTYHPKVVPLPLGLHWRKANETTQARLAASKAPPPTNQLFVKFKIPRHQNGTARGVVRMLRRAEVVKSLHDNGFPGMTAEEIQARIPLEEFQRQIINSQFIPSPGGNGLDTYRIWQTLYLGRVPIVDTAMRPDIFEGLPVVVVDNWAKVTQESLQQWQEAATRRQFNTGKLWFRWWVAFILRECLNTP
eukprot:GGOE01040996.1.p1 GENE.GGOE01040996.1~~GGOE01040996.1.p1  ORF type:complete len:513 (+),score=99.92 GGOE01040996.1:113-1651(+)